MEIWRVKLISSQVVAEVEVGVELGKNVFVSVIVNYPVGNKGCSYLTIILLIYIKNIQKYENFVWRNPLLLPVLILFGQSESLHPSVKSFEILLCPTIVRSQSG